MEASSDFTVWRVHGISGLLGSPLRCAGDNIFHLLSSPLFSLSSLHICIQVASYLLSSLAIITSHLCYLFLSLPYCVAQYGAVQNIVIYECDCLRDFKAGAASNQIKENKNQHQSESNWSLFLRSRSFVYTSLKFEQFDTCISN